jgi:glycosyltransferase involved in cell wall biosynthesis
MEIKHANHWADCEQTLVFPQQKRFFEKAPSRCGRRLLVSEEGLINEVGHWYEYCKSVVDIHAPYGIQSYVAMHANATDAVRSSIPSLPVYPQTSWSGLHLEPNIAKRYLGILSHNYAVYRTMDRVIREKGPFDVIFAPTVTIHHLIGWRGLVVAHAGSGFKRLVLLFRNNAGYYTESSDTPKFRRSARILALIIKSFSPLIKSGAVALATDSDRLADEYETLCGLRPVVFPSPRIAERGEDCPTEHAPKESATVRISCLGPARFEKGIDVLQHAIKRVLARRKSSDLSFVIQWNEQIRDSAGKLYGPEPTLLTDRRVRFLTEPLSSAEYNSQVARTDCMVLPYRRASYFARISGVAVEGVTVGAPIIYTRNTWCENLVKNYGAGIGVPDGDVDALAQAIEDMADNYAIYKAKAVAKAAEARHLNSPEAFIERLWGPLFSSASAQDPATQR